MKNLLILLAGVSILCLSSCGENSASTNEITVVSREAGSGTRSAFVELFGIEKTDALGNREDLTTQEAVIANKTDIMLTNVSGDINAIGYISIGSLNDRVKAVRIDGAQANSENVKNGTYKVSRPFNIAVKSQISEGANDFISFILSEDGQKIVSQNYVSSQDAPLPFNTSSPSGKISISGSSSVAPLMEKLKEAYEKINPKLKIEIQMSDSTSGITSALEGSCDIAMTSRALNDREKQSLTPIEIALDGIAVIVNVKNPRNEFTKEQIKSIFTGEVTRFEMLENNL